VADTTELTQRGSVSDRVLVVGGTRGTGLLIARLLLERGYQVRVLARDVPRAAQTLGSEIEVLAGDITQPYTLFPAVEGVDHVIVTAGIRSGRFAGESQVKETDHQGVLNVLEAARDTGVNGRFMYMNSIGIRTPSWAATVLNLVKGNTLVWRGRLESSIRASGVDYTIIRTGFLLNAPGGQRAVLVGQGALPLRWRYRIARADVAEAFVEALRHPRASRATFEVAWAEGPRREAWAAMYNRLRPDRSA
jgi:uncharacterized protein YbjT (DUF2867 family)